MSISFRIEADQNVKKTYKRILSDLVSERNQLIHRDLANFDSNSAEYCRKLIASLDEQNERLKRQSDAFMHMIKSITEAKAVALKASLSLMEASDSSNN